MQQQVQDPCGQDRQTDHGARMKYEFACRECEVTNTVDSKPFHPPEPPLCDCGQVMDRLYNSQINTYGCRDHDHVPERYRVPDGERTPTRAGAEAKEVQFQRHLRSRRSQLREVGQNNSFRHTHSVPSDLYWGKVRETGDRNYWSDSSNLKRHSSTRVS